MVEQAAEENRSLKLRAQALEHAVASRDQQLEILAQFKQALALGPAADKEAQELLQAASMPFSAMVSSTRFEYIPYSCMSCVPDYRYRDIDTDSCETLWDAKPCRACHPGDKTDRLRWGDFHHAGTCRVE